MKDWEQRMKSAIGHPKLPKAISEDFKAATDEVDNLRRMLVNVIDANYGTTVHDIGNGDGLAETEAAEIREFWQAYLERKTAEYYETKNT